ncbi:hypothetical protein [Clostridium sardiniense]|uniref:hypothetical protein n=1 Tax=Clostridium sardiniense TaxID=29369 RepID=UPI001FAE7A56|nr:hypothetical protein [Clostridium sardiniense]MBM7836691.1 histidinol phosphatase-like PHP family hydrolase [Clostridium sardiniense]
MDKCSRDIKPHKFDFVIASIHSIDKLELFTGDFHKGKSQKEAYYEKYYKRLLSIITNYKDETGIY